MPEARRLRTLEAENAGLIMAEPSQTKSINTPRKWGNFSFEVIMEACGGAHHSGRVLARLGHEVRLIPAQYVRPFVRRAKNDRTDAEAINDVASRSGMP